MRARPLAVAASLGVLLAGWGLASALLPPRYLPSPAVVALALAGNLAEVESWQHIVASLRRAFGGFAMALAAGTALGVLMGLSRRVEYLCDRWVVVGLGIPSLCWAYVGLMFFGLSELGVYFAVLLIVLPFVVVNVWQGMRTLDAGLVQMSVVFQLSRPAVVHHVVLPQLVPFLFSATRYGLGLAWKATAVAELVSQQNGIGYVFGRAFGLFDMAELLAWTATFVLLMLATEFLLVRGLELQLTAWRREVRL